MNKYYIVIRCIDHYYTDDPWTPAAGPFASKNEAEVFRPRFEKELKYDGARIRAKVVSRTQLHRMGYKKDAEGEAVIRDWIFRNRILAKTK